MGELGNNLSFKNRKYMSLCDMYKVILYYIGYKYISAIFRAAVPLAYPPPPTYNLCIEFYELYNDLGYILPMQTVVYCLLWSVLGVICFCLVYNCLKSEK